MFFYFPGDVHRISAQTVPWEYYWMTCDGAHLDEVIAGFELERRTHPAGKAPRDLFARLGLELRDLTGAANTGPGRRRMKFCRSAAAAAMKIFRTAQSKPFSNWWKSASTTRR